MKVHDQRFLKFFELYLQNEQKQSFMAKYLSNYRQQYILCIFFSRYRKPLKRIKTVTIIISSIFLGFYLVPGNNGKLQEKLKYNTIKLSLSGIFNLQKYTVDSTAKSYLQELYLKCIFKSYFYLKDNDIKNDSIGVQYLEAQFNLLKENPLLINSSLLYSYAIIQDLVRFQKMNILTDDNVQKQLANLLEHIANINMDTNFELISQLIFISLAYNKDQENLNKSYSSIISMISRYPQLRSCLVPQLIQNKIIIYKHLASPIAVTHNLSLCFLNWMNEQTKISNQTQILRSFFEDNLLANLLKNIDLRGEEYQIQLNKLLQNIGKNQEIIYLLRETNIFTNQWENIMDWKQQNHMNSHLQSTIQEIDKFQ